MSTIAKGLTAILVVSAISKAHADGISLESTGARIGCGSSHNFKDFYEAEGFADLNLPWQWKVNERWQLVSRLDLGMGWLGETGSDAVIGEVGPLLAARRGTFPVTFSGGVNLTGLSRSAFDTQDFGIKFQFTSHFDVNWDFTNHWRFAYRFQHMSNAGLGTPNPGLNMHVVAVSYVF